MMWEVYANLQLQEVSLTPDGLDPCWIGDLVAVCASEETARAVTRLFGACMIRKV